MWQFVSYLTRHIKIFVAQTALSSAGVVVWSRCSTHQQLHVLGVQAYRERVLNESDFSNNIRISFLNPIFLTIPILRAFIFMISGSRKCIGRVFWLKLKSRILFHFFSRPFINPEIGISNLRLRDLANVQGEC